MGGFKWIMRFGLSLNAICVKRSKTIWLKFMFADQGAKQGAKGKLKLLQSKIIFINHSTISISLLLSNPFPALFHKA